MTNSFGHCPMCDKDKDLTDHHEKLLDGKKIGMCDDCQTLIHRYFEYLELRLNFKYGK